MEEDLDTLGSLQWKGCNLLWVHRQLHHDASVCPRFPTWRQEKSIS